MPCTFLGEFAHVEVDVAGLQAGVEHQQPQAPVGEVDEVGRLAAPAPRVLVAGRQGPRRPQQEVQGEEQPVPEVEAGHVPVLLPLKQMKKNEKCLFSNTQEFYIMFW